MLSLLALTLGSTHATGQNREIEAFFTRIGEMDSITAKNMREQLQVTVDHVLLKNRSLYDSMAMPQSEKLSRAQSEAIKILIKYNATKADALELALNSNQPQKSEYFFDSLLLQRHLDRIPELDSALRIQHVRNLANLEEGK